MHAKQQPKASFFFVNPKVMVKTFCLYFIIGGVHCIHYKGYGSLPRRPSYLHFQFYLFPSFQREECLAPLHFTPKPIYQFARGEVERGCRPWTAIHFSKLAKMYYYVLLYYLHGQKLFGSRCVIRCRQRFFQTFHRTVEKPCLMTSTISEAHDCCASATNYFDAPVSSTKSTASGTF